eukprot:TRINITY_DN11885_c2_g1_i1.p1 TRINITY_DN11885_c2_g1~~TRINITY_DN11885_c2_g1_i1.p1  ORF type:complete len:148 (+),score=6.59 TRINITY_DN11885_c2_g1_i1:186-629(+)
MSSGSSAANGTPEMTKQPMELEGNVEGNLTFSGLSPMMMGTSPTVAVPSNTPLHGPGLYGGATVPDLGVVSFSSLEDASTPSKQIIPQFSAGPCSPAVINVPVNTPVVGSAPAFPQGPTTFSPSHFTSPPTASTGSPSAKDTAELST